MIWVILLASAVGVVVFAAGFAVLALGVIVRSMVVLAFGVVMAGVLIRGGRWWDMGCSRWRRCRHGRGLGCANAHGFGF